MNVRTQKHNLRKEMNLNEVKKTKLNILNIFSGELLRE